MPAENAALMVLAALGLAAACSSSSGGGGSGGTTTTISASNYDQICQVASDCVAVPVGDPCGPGCGLTCSGAAINVSAKAQYDADVARATASCAMPALACPVHCVPVQVSCAAGTCESCAQGSSCYDAGTGDAAPE